MRVIAKYLFHALSSLVIEVRDYGTLRAAKRMLVSDIADLFISIQTVSVFSV